MKYVLMNSNGDFKKMKRIMPGDKSKKLALKETVKEEKPEKEVDIAEYTIEDNEFSRELKKRTDIVFRGYFKADPPIPLTYIGFEKDMNAVVEGVLNDQDKKKKQSKKNKRAEKLKLLKNKLFKRRKNG